MILILKMYELYLLYMQKSCRVPYPIVSHKIGSVTPRRVKKAPFREALPVPVLVYANGKIKLSRIKGNADT